MLILLANISRPDISYDVQKCAKLNNFQKSSQGAAAKRIIWYLQGTKDKGLIISPIKSLQVECHVDADFSGLWNV